MRLGELDKVSKMQESEQLKNDQVPEAIPDKDLLNNLVKVAPKIVAVCKNKIRKDPTVASPADFVNIFLNRDFYILIQDYLKERMTSTDIPTFSEIKELIRVWILQFVWGTTSSKIFNDSEWYSKGSQLNI